MTPAQLDIVLNGAFICERPDGSLYAAWGCPPRWTRDKVIRRTGPLTKNDLARPSSEVLADHNAQLSGSAA